MKTPADLGAEQAVIGCVLRRHSVVTSVIGLDANDFHHPVHREIWKAILALTGRQEPIDPQTIQSEMGPPDRIGEMIAMLDRAISADNVEHYARTVTEKAILRRMIDVTASIQARAHAGEDAAELMAAAQSDFFTLSQYIERGEPEPLARVMIQTIERLAKARSGEVSGLPTGFKDVDRHIGGLREGELILLAARPGRGKTALAIQIARNIGQRRVPVLVFSIEMPANQIAERMLAADSHTDLAMLRRGCTEDAAAWRRAVQAAPGLARDTAMWLDQNSAPTIAEIRSKSARWAAKNVKERGKGLVVVDYLQLVRGGSEKASRQQQLGDVSRGLKALSKDLHMPVLALAQLNRDVEKREDKRPILADLREAGDLEQDGDIVLMLYREEGTDSENQPELLIRKHRNGPTGTVKLTFVGAETRFEDAAPEWRREEWQSRGGQ